MCNRVAVLAMLRREEAWHTSSVVQDKRMRLQGLFQPFKDSTSLKPEMQTVPFICQGFSSAGKFGSEWSTETASTRKQAHNSPYMFWQHVLSYYAVQACASMLCATRGCFLWIISSFSCIQQFLTSKLLGHRVPCRRVTVSYFRSGPRGDIGPILSSEDTEGSDKEVKICQESRLPLHYMPLTKIPRHSE